MEVHITQAGTAIKALSSDDDANMGKSFDEYYKGGGYARVISVIRRLTKHP
jgi:hypothetical protein